MKPESRFWRWLEKRLPPGHYSRVEPPPSPGVPDVHYCIEGYTGWMELKLRQPVKYPFKKRGLLRTTQRRWFKSHIRAHGRVLTCARIGSYVHLIDAQNSLRVARTTGLLDFKAMCFAVIPMKDLSIGDNDGLLRRALRQIPEALRQP